MSIFSDLKDNAKLILIRTKRDKVRQLLDDNQKELNYLNKEIQRLEK